MSSSNYGTSGGIELTDELVERLAQEAEEGYAVERLRPRSRRGRPPIGSEAAAPFQVRLDPELRRALTSVAKLQGASPSETARRALRRYLEGDAVAGVAGVDDSHPTRSKASRRAEPAAGPVSKAGLVDQQVLLQWADMLGARSELPRLVRRLILETARGVVQLGFPAGEGIVAGSWDGSVRATEPTAFIPNGLSLWELSVEKAVGKKAESDYRKRLTTIDGSPTTSCTYVAVSLRRWRDRHRWARDRTADGRWAEVRAYGLDDIETWLETAPVTHAWISEELGLGPYGLRAAESWWTSWSSASTPSVSAPLVLAGRAAFVDELRKRLEGRPQLTTVKARSVEDVLAAVAAVGKQAEADGDPRPLARMAFVDDVRTWRALAGRSGELVLVAAAKDVIAEASSGTEHHVVVPVTGLIDADIELPPIDSHDAVAALKEAGVDNHQRAEELGRLARRSLVALRRNIANRPELHLPHWAHSPVPRELRAALLAGRWREGTGGDRAILEALSGVGYEEFRTAMTAGASQDDPLVTPVDQSWALVSPFDAWMLLGPHLYEEDLKRLEGVVREVLGELDPALDSPADARWRASLEGKVLSYSHDLRRGLAESLALLGSHGSVIQAGGRRGTAWASHLVRSLLISANEDPTLRTWASIAELLPLLVEGAPDSFLEAVREAATGEQPLLAGIFTDRHDAGAIGVHSPHVGLLWALENAAWSRDYFGHAVALLARLAEIDPGGRLSSRPLASLAAIFWPLRPATSVDVAGRLRALDSLRRRHKKVAWRLMLNLLPDVCTIHALTYEPQFRDWRTTRASATMMESMRFVGETVTRILVDAATTDDWVALLDLQ
jgi:predicted HicB family RNase H-like nuclease